MDKRIAEYINKQPSPQKEILKKVRSLILKTLPGCGERMAWGVVTFAEDKFYIAAMRERVHVGFAINGLSAEEKKLFEGGGKTMRHIKIPALAGIDKEKLVRLIKLVDKKAVSVH